jgi:hypothetical protein
LRVGNSHGQVRKICSQQRQGLCIARNASRRSGLNILCNSRKRAERYSHCKIGGIHKLKDCWLTVEKEGSISNLWRSLLPALRKEQKAACLHHQADRILAIGERRRRAL